MSAKQFDEAAVDRFAAAMKEKLAKKRRQGYSGWEDCSGARLSRMLVEHVNKGDPVDIGNFAMMLWNNDQGADFKCGPALKAALREVAASILEQAP